MSMIGRYIAVSEEKLNAILEGSEDILSLNPDKYKTLDIDKTWQAIPFLLYGIFAEEKPPASYVVPLSQSALIDSDMEFGAFYLIPENVKEALNYLDSLDDATLKSSYSFSAMLENEIYPITSDEDGEEFYEYIHAYLLEIRKFYREAAKNNHGVIFFIS